MNGQIKKIMVVEDEWMIGEYIADFLIDAGHEVLGPLPNVAQALAVLDRVDHNIDVALLDISLGKEKSFPIAEALLSREVPFIFLSGYTEANLPVSLQHAKLLQKPVQLPQLAEALRDMLPSRMRGLLLS